MEKTNSQPIDYEKFVELVQLVLDNEASPEEVDLCRQRMECCGKSLELYMKDKQFLETLRQKLSGNKECCPCQVAEEIRNQIRQYSNVER